MRSLSLSGRTALDSVSTRISDPQWNAKYYFMSKWNQGNLMSQLTEVVYMHVHALTHQMVRWAFIRLYMLRALLSMEQRWNRSLLQCASSNAMHKKCIYKRLGGSKAEKTSEPVPRETLHKYMLPTCRSDLVNRAL